MLNYDLRFNFDDLERHGDLWIWKNVVSDPNWLLDTVRKESYFEWQDCKRANGESLGKEKRLFATGAPGTDGINELSFYILQAFNTFQFNAANHILQEKGLSSKDYDWALGTLALRIWESSDPMTEHSDVHFINGKEVVPDFQSIYYLTENLEGAEIFFPEINFTLKDLHNTLIIFPGTMLHGVNGIKSGYRLFMGRPIIRK